MPGGLLKGIPMTTKACECGRVFRGQREICLRCRQRQSYKLKPNSGSPPKPWSQRSPEEKALALGKAKRWRAANPGYMRAWWLRSQYGLSIQDFERMLAAQGRLCAGCAEPFDDDGRDIVVDHDHATNAIRGLLHRICNSVLGLLDESPQKLRALATHLERHKAANEVAG